MLQLDPPESTSVGHAVRWITTGQRCLGYKDSVALGDFPTLDETMFDSAKSDLLLALRHGVINSTGNLEVFDKRYSVYKNNAFLGDDNWDDFLSQYAGQVSNSREGRCFVGHSIDIPSDLWDAKLISWHSNCLGYPNGWLQARFLTVFVPTNELFSAFGAKVDETVAPGLGEIEKKSLLKLIAAMSIEGYRFNPNASKNEAVSDIASDLERLGIPLDLKTIRKWLREASKEVAAEYEYKSEKS